MSSLAPWLLWFKAFHIVSVVAWMAGLLYLPRLFVYHASAPKGSEQSETFKTMERRLFRGIMNPAMIATYVFGVLLLLTPGTVEWDRFWIWAKLLAVAALTGFHHLLGRWRKDFAEDRNARRPVFYRAVNELPTLLLILIVVLVVVRPF
ncbi:MAG TPA: protoporphyrinogen oxidase HemJ [Stellaceae bacterium]|nr:protoporphyrinogen oxidase HemJ [Stellaceae bacterium]HYC13099.1 protoporphyrinogen oxidase HemJ [Stellaceae bacterium]